MEMMQLNILNDLVGLMQESDSKSVSDIVMSEKQHNQIGTMFSWFDTLKILILSIIGFIVFIVCQRIFIICKSFTRIMAKIRQTRRLRRYGINMEETHKLTSMIANSNIQPPEEIIEQQFTRMTAPTSLTMERPSQSRPAQPSAPKQRGIYPIMEENWESDQARKCTGKQTTCTYVVGYGMKNNEETLVMEWGSEDTVHHNEASDGEKQPETNYIVIERDIETESETQRDGLFGDYARADAIRKRTQAITRLRDQEIFLEMIDAPREEIRKCIIQKLGPAAWDYHPKAEFLNQKFNNKTLLHASVKAGKLDITDLLLDYGADPDIKEDGQTIAHRAAAENNKLFIRVLRYHKYKFSSYNSLGETPLMVAIAYGHEEVASYLWISSNVAQMAKDNSTVLHYAAKNGNNSLARAACERKIHININQTTRPGNYTALHLATMYSQDNIINILLEHGANTNITDVNGNTPRDYAFDGQRTNLF
ncbi:hypothetical protein OUZ56_032809 [Daphnia magna]|uniref:Uncharacterized protein n=1 Tax=Daphnia magna TaxID=35525 RepID=A0ABR0B9L8_9CRUS|nr:hypothetical protein OUZ56_032809 [Daphnia magna]